MDILFPQNIVIVNYFCCFLSIIGNIYILFEFFSTKTQPTIINDFIYFISFFECFSAFGKTLSLININLSGILTYNKTLCLTQSFIITTSDILSLFFLLLIQFFTILSIKITRTKKLLKLKRISTILACILFIIIFVLVNIHSFKQTTTKTNIMFSCYWLLNKDKDNLYYNIVFILSYVIVLLIFVCFVIIVFIWKDYQGKMLFEKSIDKNALDVSEMVFAIKQRFCFGLVGIVGWILFTIEKECELNLKQYYLYYEREGFHLLMFSECFNSLKGFFVFLIFAPNSKYFSCSWFKLDKEMNSSSLRMLNEETISQLSSKHSLNIHSENSSVLAILK